MTYYHGKLPDAVYVVEDNGDRALLKHHVKHSPTGFSWGYGGSGPADLARSLLIDALGDEATCKICGGSGWVTEDKDGREVPAPARAEYAWNCSECESGCMVVPGMYQQFKWDVVARLPQDGDWTMTHQEVMDWFKQSW